MTKGQSKPCHRTHEQVDSQNHLIEHMYAYATCTITPYTQHGVIWCLHHYKLPNFLPMPLCPNLLSHKTWCYLFFYYYMYIVGSILTSWYPTCLCHCIPISPHTEYGVNWWTHVICQCRPDPRSIYNTTCKLYRDILNWCHIIVYIVVI